MNDAEQNPIVRLKPAFPLEIAVLLAVVILACAFVVGRGLMV
jgi:hypothetical protein